MNTKKDKIELLKAIQSGEIRADQLKSESLIVSEGKEAFTGYMANVASKKKGIKPRAVFIGEAKRLMDQTAANIEAQRSCSKK